MQWIDKYKPQNINDIIGNEYNIITIKKWFNNFDEKKTKNTKNKERILLINGPNGVGKTTIINCVCNDLNYNVISPNINTLVPKMIHKTLNECMGYKSVKNYFTLEKNVGDKIVLFDNIDILSQQSIKEIIQCVKQNNINFPIICTTNNVSDKKIKLLKTHSKLLTVKKPKNIEIIEHLKKICDAEKMYISEDFIRKVIIYCDSDTRKIITALYDIYLLYGSGIIITEEMLDNAFKSFSKNDYQHELYDSAANILKKKINIDKCIDYYEYDTYLLPYMIYENYIKYTKDVGKIAECSKSFSNFDMNSSLSFGENIDNNYLLCLDSCIMPNEIINNIGVNGSTSGVKYGTYNNFIGFPVLLNNKSIKKSNIKMNNDVYNTLNFVDIDKNDIIYLSEFLIDCIFVKPIKYKKLKKIMKKYDLSINDVESLLKINKYHEHKFTSSIKKSILNNND